MKISVFENRVLDVLWGLGRSAPSEAIAGILAAEMAGIEIGWTDGTVRLLLLRLAAKGAVTAQADGETWLYRPLIEREVPARDQNPYSAA